jgi:hypothetical protein
MIHRGELVEKAVRTSGGIGTETYGCASSKGWDGQWEQ